MSRNMASMTLDLRNGRKSSAWGTTRQALRNFSWLMGDKVLSVVLGLMVFGLIARTYGSTGAGHYGFGVALLQTTLGLSLVCSAAAVLPRFWRMRSGHTGAIGNVFVVRMGASVLCMAAAMLYSALTTADPDRRTIALIMLASVPLIEPFYVAAVYWQSRNRNGPQVLARSSGLIARALFVWGAIALKVPVWIIALAWVLEAVVMATLQAIGILRIAPLKRIARGVTRGRSITYLRFGLRFVAGMWFAHLFLRLDRLYLSGQMDASEFGYYAAAMQVVEAWLQVAALTSASIAPAFLYRHLATAASWWEHWKTVLGLATLGVSGFLISLLLGKQFLMTVFGPQFAQSYGYVVAGTAFGVLVFIDQFTQIALTSRDRPALLALKWGVSCIAAFAAQWWLFKHIGAYAGPAGLAVGLCVGWLVLLLWVAFSPRRQQAKQPADAVTKPVAKT